MLDPFYAFLIFVLIVAFDILAAQTWLAPYFRFGIPVYSRQLKPARLLELPALDSAFKSSPLNPSVRFKALDAARIAFREVLFENRAGLRYLPVMHMLLHRDESGQPGRISGYLNWYVLAALAYIVYRSINETSYLPVAVLILVVLGLSYAGQASLNNRVAQAIEA